MNFVMEDTFGRFFKDTNVLEDRKQNPLLVLQMGPALDAYTAFLHEEMRQCYSEGLDHAAIVTACAVLEFTIKSTIYFEEDIKAGRKFDQAKWDEIDEKDFSTLINWARSLGIITKDGHRILDTFRDAVRNKYMHGTTPQRVKDTKLRVFEGNWQTGEAEVREIELSTDLSLQRTCRLVYDRMQCRQVVTFVDQAVRENLAKMNARLAKWEREHPSPQPSMDQIHALMDKMKEQGFHGGMAIMREIPCELREAAEEQNRQDTRSRS